MRVQTKEFASVAGAAVVITKDDAGYDLLTMFGVHHVAASGLDGGAYRVEFKMAGDDTTWRVATVAAVETSPPLKLDVPLVQIRVTFSALGAGQAAKVHLVSRPWANYRQL